MARRRSETMSAIDVIMPLVDRFHELEQEDQRIFLDMVDPLPDEVEQPVPKKPRKRGRKAGSKSPRASSIAAAVATRRIDPQVPGFADDTDMVVCGRCDYTADHNIHHMQSMTGYHEFQPANEQSIAVVGGD